MSPTFRHDQPDISCFGSETQNNLRMKTGTNLLTVAVGGAAPGVMSQVCYADVDKY